MTKSRKIPKIKGGIPNLGDIRNKMGEIKDRIKAKFSKPKTLPEYVPSNDAINEKVDTRLDEIRDKLEEVLPESEKKFQEYVDHEWDNCTETVKGWISNTTRKLSREEFMNKIKADPSYDTTNFKDEDYDKLHIRCSSANKEDFSKRLRETDEGKFILNPRTGGKRNKTRKNKRKSKTYKKGRK
jgi:predicted nuclease with TOPRIM domain